MITFYYDFLDIAKICENVGELVRSARKGRRRHKCYAAQFSPSERERNENAAKDCV